MWSLSRELTLEVRLCTVYCSVSPSRELTLEVRLCTVYCVLCAVVCTAHLADASYYTFPSPSSSPSFSPSFLLPKARHILSGMLCL